VRDPQAFAVAAHSGLEHDFGTLRGHKYCLLISVGASGRSVPTPVWFGLADGRLYVRTLVDAGKVKRIRRDPRVRVAPSNARGKPRGALVEGRARVLDPEDEQRAEAALAANYGWGRRLYERLAARGGEAVYLEISPIAREEA
jgi:PPOX class probable F420-dependent enzyme